MLHVRSTCAINIILSVIKFFTIIMIFYILLTVHPEVIVDFQPT
jgi:hypothetical protein